MINKLVIELLSLSAGRDLAFVDRLAHDPDVCIDVHE